MDKTSSAAASLSEGRFVVIYDGDSREGEADLVIGAKFATPKYVETMRRDAGGLICVAIGSGDAKRFGLPFMADVLCGAGAIAGPLVCDRTAYGDKPAFSLAVNHRKTYTGITDNDRALTITKVGEIVSDSKADSSMFASEFYSPGHVFLLIGRGIENRRGHTELSLELGARAGLGAMVLCEMLGSGRALAKKDAMDYAAKHGLVFLEGKDVIGAAGRGRS